MTKLNEGLSHISDNDCENRNLMTCKSFEALEYAILAQVVNLVNIYYELNGNTSWTSTGFSDGDTSHLNGCTINAFSGCVEYYK